MFWGYNSCDFCESNGDNAHCKPNSPPIRLQQTLQGYFVEFLDMFNPLQRHNILGKWFILGKPYINACFWLRNNGQTASIEKFPCATNSKLITERQKASSATISKSGINIEPWCILGFTSTFSLNSWLKRILLLVLSYMNLTSFIVYSDLTATFITD